MAASDPAALEPSAEGPVERYGMLLGSLLLLLVVFPFVEELGPAKLIFGAFYTLIVVNVIYSLSNRRVLFWVLLGLAIPSTLAHWLGIFSDSETLRAVSAVLSTLLLGYTAVLILQDVLRAERVTAQKVCGALCVYLIFGVVWAELFVWVGSMNPSAFGGGVEDSTDFAEMLYFSFVTLTTLGYGDIVPVTRLARMMTSLEALLGQLYLAVLVARLVGLHIAYSNAGRR